MQLDFTDAGGGWCLLCLHGDASMNSFAPLSGDTASTPTTSALPWLPRNGLALSWLQLWLCHIIPRKIKCANRSLISLSLMENTQFTLNDMVEAKRSSGILETWIPVSGIAIIAWYWLQSAWSNHEPKAEQVPGAGPAELCLHPRMEISQLLWAPVSCFPKLTEAWFHGVHL